MEILFGLYIIALCAVAFIGYKAVKVTLTKRVNAVDRIASLQHWEYLRSLEKDGYNRTGDKAH